jgi:hypothetical protein
VVVVTVAVGGGGGGVDGGCAAAAVCMQEVVERELSQVEAVVTAARDAQTCMRAAFEDVLLFYGESTTSVKPGAGESAAGCSSPAASNTNGSWVQGDVVCLVVSCCTRVQYVGACAYLAVHRLDYARCADCKLLYTC